MILDQEQTRFLAGLKTNTDNSSASPKGKEGVQGLLPQQPEPPDFSARP